MQAKSVVRSGLSMVVVLVSACAAGGQTQSRQEANLQVEQPTRIAHRWEGVRLSPISAPVAVAFPYRGQAEAILSSDGKLELLIGDENSDVRNPDEPGRVGRESIVFHLNTGELSIVESDREIFLDRNGAQTLERGLSHEVLDVMPVDVGDSVPPEELLRISGSAFLDLDQTNHRFTIAIKGADQRTFKLTARVAWMEPVSLQTGDALVLNVASPGGEPPWASGCNACCGSQGEYCCTINCVGECRARCNGKDPVCSCLGME